MTRPFCVVLVLCLAGSALAGWSFPLEMPGTTGRGQSTPRVVRGSGGQIFVAYVDADDTDSELRLMERSVSGSWSEHDDLPSMGFCVRPDVVQDLDGRPHVVLAVKNPTAYDLYHVYRDNGQWVTGFVTATSDFEDQPRLVADPSTDIRKRVHLLYTQGAVESSTANVIYRVWTPPDCATPPCGWSGEALLGTATNAFFHRPDILIDSAGNIHVVWVRSVAGVYKVQYRRNTGGLWGPTINIGSGAASGHFFSHPRIACAGPNKVAVVWQDDPTGGGSNIHWNYSINGGTSWVFLLSGSDQGPLLHSGMEPRLESGFGASAHLVNVGLNEISLVHRQWTGGDASTWSTGATIHSSAGAKFLPAIAQDPSDDHYLHVVWEHEVGAEPTDHLVAYSTTAPDLPPGPVLNFTATGFDGFVRLRWTNPSDPDFAFTRVCWSTQSPPTDPELCSEGYFDRAADPGSLDSVDHGVDYPPLPLNNGTLYFYTAFTYDLGNLRTEGMSVSAIPFGYVAMDADQDMDVDQGDFGSLQQCFGDPPPPLCEWADFTGDGIVNEADLAKFLLCQSGPDIDYSPSCDD